MIYTCYIAERVRCDAPSTKRQCSCGDDLLTLSEYHINKDLTGDDLLTLSEYHINKDLTGVQGQRTVSYERTMRFVQLECIHSDTAAFLFVVPHRFDSNKIVMTV